MPRTAPAGDNRQDQEWEDHRWMERAITLAQKSVGLASPNPAVGCVLVREGNPVGEGFHQYDALDHAEVAALKHAGSGAEGATAYVTLEPCSHYGRTGPCADALIEAGVRRVVIATIDPNPLVRGRGIERLRAAGVEVSTGLLASDARRLNDSFAKFARTGLPFVTMKIASSLDGRIAPAGQAPKSAIRITGEAARAEVHRMRHGADALLTGVGTILADDPLLTDRSSLPRRRPLLRVVLDSALRTPPDSRLVSSANGDLLILFTDAPAGARQALEARGARVERVAEGEPAGHIALAPALKHLAQSEITSVLVEGGARLNAAMLNSKLVDKLVIFYAPTLLGGDAIPALASDPGPDAIGKLSGSTLKSYGDDFAFAGYVRDPWAGID